MLHTLILPPPTAQLESPGRSGASFCVSQCTLSAPNPRNAHRPSPTPPGHPAIAHSVPRSLVPSFAPVPAHAQPHTLVPLVLARFHSHSRLPSVPHRALSRRPLARLRSSIRVPHVRARTDPFDEWGRREQITPLPHQRWPSRCPPPLPSAARRARRARTTLSPSAGCRSRALFSPLPQRPR